MIDHLEHALPHSHDAGLVTLSILIAILASYTALDLASRVSAIRGRIQYVWLLSGSVAMGLGIWSMHFVAMLAFRLPVAVTYDVLLVTVSLLAAMVASALALFLASRASAGWRQLIPGSLLMGVAIAGMHYIGMAAMRLPAQLSYQPLWFAFSIVIAIVASWAALWLAVRFRAAATRREFVGKVISAVVMGFAIASMHYTGMASAVFVPDASLPSNPLGSIAINLLGVSALAGGTVLVLAFAIIGSLLDQRVSRLSYPQK
ncbi:MAG: MHYT domain-containing protein, partial [Anaerolineales bacterium]